MWIRFRCRDACKLARETIEWGDKIIIEVIDNNFDDPAQKGINYTEEEVKEREIRYFNNLKEELKDYL